MDIVAVVPMKRNNCRLPQKNTKAFTNGKPLCFYILSTLLQIEELNAVYVYCSDPGIQDYLPHGVRYVRRSEELDRDTTKMNEVLKCFAQDIPSDIYVMAHTTAPFVKKTSIQRGISAVLNGSHDSSFAVRKVQDFLWKDGNPMNYDLDNIPRTQDLPNIYQETSGFYIYRSEVIHQYNRRIGNTPYMVEVGEVESIDIDEQEDFEIADAVYNHIFLGKGKTGE